MQFKSPYQPKKILFKSYHFIFFFLCRKTTHNLSIYSIYISVSIYLYLYLSIYLSVKQPIHLCVRTMAGDWSPWRKQRCGWNTQPSGTNNLYLAFIHGKSPVPGDPIVIQFLGRRWTKLCKNAKMVVRKFFIFFSSIINIWFYVVRRNLSVSRRKSQKT